MNPKSPLAKSVCYYRQKVTNEGKVICKEYFKRTTKLEFKLRLDKILINCRHRKTKVAAGRKTFIKEFDLQCKTSKKGTVEMEHESSEGERRKNRDIQTNTECKLLNRTR